MPATREPWECTDCGGRLRAKATDRHDCKRRRVYYCLDCGTRFESWEDRPAKVCSEADEKLLTTLARAKPEHSH